MEGQAAFVSKLPEGATRFLSEALDHALTHGRRSADDFIRHFPPATIMAALDAVPNLRSAFLVTLVGVKERTALRTSTSDAGRLLESALEEGDTDASSVVTIFSPDDRIRYLDARKVWTFLLEGDFWKVARSKDGGAYKVAQGHVAFLLDRALAQRLVSHGDIIDGITIDVIAEKLPRNDMARILKAALTTGRTSKPFTDPDLYNAVTAATLVDYVPLPHIMQSVVAPMALAAGFTEPPAQRAEPTVTPERAAPTEIVNGASTPSMSWGTGESQRPADAWPEVPPVGS